MRQEKPIGELEKLLPKLKGKLVPADSGFIRRACEILRQHPELDETGKEIIIKNYVRYLTGILETHGFYKENQESRELFKKAIDIMGEIYP